MIVTSLCGESGIPEAKHGRKMANEVRLRRGAHAVNLWSLVATLNIGARAALSRYQPYQ